MAHILPSQRGEQAAMFHGLLEDVEGIFYRTYDDEEHGRFLSKIVSGAVGVGALAAGASLLRHEGRTSKVVGTAAVLVGAAALAHTSGKLQEMGTSLVDYTSMWHSPHLSSDATGSVPRVPFELLHKG